MLIEAENINRSYNEGDQRLDVLKSCSVSIKAGEFVAIMGPSGSGKTTLMNLLGLLDRPDSGTLRVCGERADTLSDVARARVRNLTFGFVFQSYNLLQRHSAIENVELPMIYAGVRAPERRMRALKALEDVGLAERQRHLPQELSGGEQQRVAIARALVNRPKLILADEPTGALDTQKGKRILEIFQQINKAGRAIVVVTHDERVAQHAQRILRMNDGEIVVQESVENRVHARTDQSAPPEVEFIHRPLSGSEGNTGKQSTRPEREPDVLVLR